MPERKRTTAKRTAAKSAPKQQTAVHQAVTPVVAKHDVTDAGAKEVCPRCGTEKFGPEQRIRAEGSRTVRYTVLVCEHGHTFARPRVRRSDELHR